jgi:biotin carboxylase
MRLLILGATREPQQWLLQAGHEAVLMSSKDKVSLDDIRSGFTQVIVVDGRSRGELVGIADQLHRARRFDAVCSFTDTWQPLANRIADALGLPRPVPPLVLELTMNKSRMRAHLAAAGVENTGFRLVESPAQLAQALDELGAPCILKPVDGEASSGVTRLDGERDIARAIAWFRDSGHAFPALIETFLTGEEFSVEAISEAGRHHILAITKKYKDTTTFVEHGHVVPALLPDEIAHGIRSHVTRVLDAIGLVAGPSHSELVVTSAGPRMVETHTRVGGDRIPQLVRLATGIDLYELTARLAAGESIADRLPAAVAYRGAAAIWYAVPSVPTDLVLSHIDEEAAVRASPGIVAVELAKKLGDRGGPVRSSLDRSGFVIACGDGPEQALARARGGTEQLRFHYRWQPEAV